MKELFSFTILKNFVLWIENKIFLDGNGVRKAKWYNDKILILNYFQQKLKKILFYFSKAF